MVEMFLEPSLYGLFVFEVHGKEGLLVAHNPVTTLK